MVIQKSSGGMGFRNLTAFNQALLTKQIWRILSNPNSLVFSTLRCKYFSHGSVLDTKVWSRPSFIWRNVVSSIPLIKEGLFWSIGNGCHTKIWLDKWLPRPTSFKVQTPVNVLNKDAYFRELIDPISTIWNTNLIKQIFNQEEVNAILSIPISHLVYKKRPYGNWLQMGTFQLNLHTIWKWTSPGIK